MDRKTPDASAFNEHRRALTNRAGTAHRAIAVDTRPKAVPGRKGRRPYRRASDARERPDAEDT